MDHSAHECLHNALKFCAHCNTVWCQTCKAEWAPWKPCLLNHYPNTFQPWYIGTVGGGFGTISGGASTITNAPTPNLTLTACAHGD